MSRLLAPCKLEPRSTTVPRELRKTRVLHAEHHDGLQALSADRLDQPVHRSAVVGEAQPVDPGCSSPVSASRTPGCRIWLDLGSGTEVPHPGPRRP